MSLSPLDRKAELVRRGIRISDIARKYNYSISHAADVLHGRRRNEVIEGAIAELIGMKPDEVFPPRDVPAAV